MKKKAALVFFGCLFSLLLSGAGEAGQIWIASDKYLAETGNKITLSLGQGGSLLHSYELLFKEGLEFIHHRPSGKKDNLSLEPAHMVYKAQVVLEEPGTHIFSAAAEGIKFVKAGNRWKLVKDNRKKSVRRSLTLNKFTKTFINVGSGSPHYKKVLGGKLEIIPLKDPGRLQVGGTLKLKVLFLGKAVEMTILKAAYLGYGGREDQVPVKKITDIMGRTDIELTRAGPWFVYTYKVVQGRKVLGRREKEIYESSLVFYVNK